ncbi:MAG3720 family protein [Mycoplasma sp. HS2188]|uniref:MAG3720 family protein n=1 Tax=Mycoplasma sp. HS2188 TaxID=2976765 RepID=UPI0021AABCA8|nr:hypothetical protein [Mycoplasma sp. HS2188]MCT4469887.1 hypothetical protein [Mycoplasma sp. HS2188]
MHQYLINIKISTENVGISIIKSDGENFNPIHKTLNAYNNSQDIDQILKNLLIFIKKNKSIKKSPLKWSIIFTNNLLNICVKNESYELNFDQKSIIDSTAQEHIKNNVLQLKDLSFFKIIPTSYIVDTGQNIKEYTSFPLGKTGVKITVNYKRYCVDKNLDLYNKIIELLHKNQINVFQKFIDLECLIKTQNIENDAMIIDSSIDAKMNVIEYENSYLAEANCEINPWEAIYDTLIHHCGNNYLNKKNINAYIKANIVNYHLMKNTNLSSDNLKTYKIISKAFSLIAKKIIDIKRIDKNKQIILRGNCSKIIKNIFEQAKFNNLTLFNDEEAQRHNIDDIDLGVITLVNDSQQLDLAQTQNVYEKEQTKNYNFFSKIFAFFNKNTNHKL